MRLTKLLMGIFVSILLAVSISCKNKPAAKEVQKPVAEGEETGQTLAKNETFDSVRKGVRLILAYDNADSSFSGTLENVTAELIKSVRVEVHLSNGIELGPTTPLDLAAGEKKDVKLAAMNQNFERWEAHAESGFTENENEHKSGTEHERGEEREHQHKNEHSENGQG